MYIQYRKFIYVILHQTSHNCTSVFHIGSLSEWVSHSCFNHLIRFCSSAFCILVEGEEMRRGGGSWNQRGSEVWIKRIMTSMLIWWWLTRKGRTVGDSGGQWGCGFHKASQPLAGSCVRWLVHLFRNFIILKGNCVQENCPIKTDSNFSPLTYNGPIQLYKHVNEMLSMVEVGGGWTGSAEGLEVAGAVMWFQERLCRRIQRLGLLDLPPLTDISQSEWDKEELC